MVLLQRLSDWWYQQIKCCCPFFAYSVLVGNDGNLIWYTYDYFDPDRLFNLVSLSHNEHTCKDYMQYMYSTFDGCTRLTNIVPSFRNIGLGWVV